MTLTVSFSTRAIAGLSLPVSAVVGMRLADFVSVGQPIRAPGELGVPLIVLLSWVSAVVLAVCGIASLVCWQWRRAKILETKDVSAGLGGQPLTLLTLFYDESERLGTLTAMRLKACGQDHGYVPPGYDPEIRHLAGHVYWIRCIF